jgi:hypothetical protein
MPFLEGDHGTVSAGNSYVAMPVRASVLRLTLLVKALLYRKF